MSPDRHLDDEQLSALLDGLAQPDDVAHAGSCTECSARVAAWRDAVRLVAVPPADPPLVTREAAIRAALSAGSEATASTGTVTPIRRSWRRSVADHGRGVAAAAAALLVVAGLSTAVAVDSSSHGSSKSTASVAKPTTAGASSPSGARVPGASAAPASGVNLGAMADASSVAAALRAEVNASSAPGPSGAASTSEHSLAVSCETQAAEAAGATGSPVVQANLTYQGTPAEAYVFVVAGKDVAVVERSAGCVPLVTLTL